jgi:hypothetical protein
MLEDLLSSLLALIADGDRLLIFSYPLGYPQFFKKCYERKIMRQSELVADTSNKDVLSHN